MVKMVSLRYLPVLIGFMAVAQLPVFIVGQGAATKWCESLDSTVASCTKKSLISAQLEGLPLGLRVLKLDENIITTIENNAFWRTPLLRELSIAQNRIHTINLDAFKDLHSLKKLNLSDNRLESFNEFLLDELSVEILDLSNNNFMYADGKIHFRSSSLMELYLRNCKIVSVNGMLKDLPSLVKVDLSSNYLVSLELPSFVPLTELRFVDLQNNHLKCDKPTQYLMEWFRKHEIKYEGPFCAVQRQEMLQRMQSLDKITQKDIDENDLLKNTSLAKINASEVEKELVMGLFNKTYFKRCLLMDHEFVCHLLENCKDSFNCEKYVQEHQRNNHMSFYLFLFVLTFGIFIGAICMLCCIMALDCCRTGKKRRRRNINSWEYNGGGASEGVQMRSINQSQRRGYSRSTAPTDRSTQSTRVDSGAVVESTGFHDFVNELFARRRSRRQMISAIGQQGTNLVRQLSRSSLNLLRRSQSRAANASARAAGMPNRPDTPTSPTYEALDPPTPPGVIPRSRSFTYSSEMVNSNNDYLIEGLLSQQQRRSESPPPNYELCVAMPKSGYVSE